MHETVSGILGRGGELRILRGLLAGAAAGRGSALLIHGEAGLGQSALLRAARAEATDRGFTVLATTGVEGQDWFPYAALDRLLRPLARGVTFEALAVLELLAEAAERRPVLLLADDLRRTDPSSLDVLSFVAHRASEHALLVVGASDRLEPGWPGPDLFLGPPAVARLPESAAPVAQPSPERALDLAGAPAARLAHEAAATAAPDDHMATRLEAYAEASLARGEAAAALPALRRAAELAGEPRRRAVLLIRAAELARTRGDREKTQALLARADLAVLDPVERARLLLVRDDEHIGVTELVAAAGGAWDAGAREVAENLLLRASSERDGDAATRAAITAELDRWAPAPDTPRLLAARAHADPYHSGLLSRLAGAEPDPADGHGLLVLGETALAVGDFTRAARLLARSATVWRSRGELGLLARALTGSSARFYLGRLSRARSDAEEGIQLADETGETVTARSLRATAALIAAVRGDTVPRLPFVSETTRQTDGLLALFDGRPDEAYGCLAGIFDRRSVSRWLVAPDLADAAVAAGRVADARDLLADRPDRLASEMMVMAHRYTSAVLAPDDEAERRYAEAVALLPPGPRLVRARLHLQHGRWLRRQHRDLDAAEPLHTARAEFDRMGARPWADMTTSELCAIGEPTRPRVPQPSELLSARELQIAELAARGLSNRQIGRRLFLSQRTIAAYLNRIYPLLGITGRCKLADVLSQH